MSDKILIIDDDPRSVEIIVEIFQKKDYDILAAFNGFDGIRIAEQKLPSLIIMDWEMDGLNGIETIKKLKQKKVTKNIPIIMATGKYLQPLDLQKALEAGALDYIRKPIDNVELQARVSSMLLLFESMKKNVELEKKMIDAEIKFLHTEVNLKNKELAGKLLQIHNYQTFTNWVLNNTQKLNKLVDNKEAEVVIREIVFKCRANNTEMFWDEFESIFQQINDEFYVALKEKFPNITPAEKRMCAFLKLNINSKDIAAITCKSIDSVRKTRHRLRKKLDLNNDEDLAVFIQNLA